jgi:DNA-binding response OmpR family regulator
VAPAARVLLVDDDALTRRFVGELLRQQGHEVHEARDGEEGLRLAREIQPRLVVLDLVMPIMDGYGVLESLKADEATRRIPVLILSVRSREEDIVKGLKLGAEDFVTKPFNAGELMLRIRKILDRTWWTW